VASTAIGIVLSFMLRRNHAAQAALAPTSAPAEEMAPLEMAG
jgi:hypothetical protein